MFHKQLLKGYSDELLNRVVQIKALFFDVDGVLTDGRITYDDNGLEWKSFHVRDGYIIDPLQKAQIILGVITGRNSESVQQRAVELKLDFCYQGVAEKFPVFEKIISEYGLEKRQVAYIGDDLNDIKILKTCGLSACPSNAPDYIKDCVHLITRNKGGEGVLREVGDLLLDVRGLLHQLVVS